MKPASFSSFYKRRKRRARDKQEKKKEKYVYFSYFLEKKRKICIFFSFFLFPRLSCSTPSCLTINSPLALLPLNSFETISPPSSSFLIKEEVGSLFFKLNMQNIFIMFFNFLVFILRIKMNS